jgi:cytochrome b561
LHRANAATAAVVKAMPTSDARTPGRECLPPTVCTASLASRMTSAPATHPVAARPRVARYGAVAIGLHWLLAAAIVASFGVGLYMHELPLSPLKAKLINWHKWAGITILALSVLRLLWRLAHRPPDLPAATLAAMAAWQQWSYVATHRLMYALFFAVPLAGWAYSSAVGFPVVWFGVVPLPDFVAVDEELAELLKSLHQLLAFALGALVMVHVAAAFKHQLVDRDGLMQRMLPTGGR